MEEIPENTQEPGRWENIGYYLGCGAALLKIALILLIALLIFLWTTDAGRKALAWLFG
ncbi:MAG: hypothetical protein KDD28_15275 [Phaeodactylibacter sp.]|nr:hypothetical protein [Phaeodactylibacter sp.]